MTPRGGRGWPAAIVILLVVAACSSDPTPEPTPVPTTFPVAGPDDAAAVADAFVAAWAADDYAAMYATLDPGLHERYTLESFTDLYASFKRMTRTAGLTATIGTPSTIGLPAEPRRSRHSVAHPVAGFHSGSVRNGRSVGDADTDHAAIRSRAAARRTRARDLRSSRDRRRVRPVR